MTAVHRPSLADWDRIKFSHLDEDNRKLRLHDQMLACIAWIIETTTELHPAEDNLEDIYRAYDFISEKRAEMERQPPNWPS